MAPLKTIITVGTSTNTAPSNAAIRYTPLCGGATINAMWQSSASMPQVPHKNCAGTFPALWVRLPVALTGTQTWTFTLVIDGIDTGLTVTFNSSTAAHPLGGQFAIISGGNIHVDGGLHTACLKSAPANTPNAQTIIQFGLLFIADSGQVGPMYTAWQSSAGGVSGWGVPNTINSSAQAESSRRFFAPTPGSISITAGTNNAPGVGQTRSVTIVVDGIDQATSTISDTNTTGNTTATIHFNAGQLVQLRAAASATAVTALTFCGITWTPDVAGETLLISTGTGNFDSTTTLFQNLQGSAENTEITETNVYNPIPVACALTKWRVDMATAPGTGKSRTVTVRKNGADTSGPVAITVQNAATSGTWSGNLPLAANDLVDWKEVPTGTPAASNPVCTSGVLVAA